MDIKSAVFSVSLNAKFYQLAKKLNQLLEKKHVNSVDSKAILCGAHNVLVCAIFFQKLVAIASNDSVATFFFFSFIQYSGIKNLTS